MGFFMEIEKLIHPKVLQPLLKRLLENFRFDGHFFYSHFRWIDEKAGGEHEVAVADLVSPRRIELVETGFALAV